jgi:hypothetical protein
MKSRFFAAAATILIAALAACATKKIRAVLVQLPCGAEKIVNGSFEQGPFLANPSGVMPLPNNASALLGWTIFSPGPNSLLWVENLPQGGVGVSTPFGSKFIDLSGSLPRNNDPKDPFPLVSQQFQLEPGRYLLQFAVGWDRARNPNGVVAVDWALFLVPVSLGTPRSGGTVQTDGSDTNNWHLFTTVVQTDGGKMTLQFATHPGQTFGGPAGGLPLFIGLDSVSLRELFPMASRACLPGTGVIIK